MFTGEFQPGRGLILFNVASLVVQGQAITPLDFVKQDLEVRIAHVSGELFGGYRLLPNNPKWDVDPLVGLKFWNTKLGVRTNVLGMIPFEGSVKKGFVDPAIGIRTKYMPHPKVELMVYGDIGGGIIGSELSNQAVAGVTYRFSKLFSTMLGYRYWEIQVPDETSVFTGRVKGWITRIGFRF